MKGANAVDLLQQVSFTQIGQGLIIGHQTDSHFLLLPKPDIDGGLIGGASLTADFFNVVNGVPK
jgi:hypothetical protein